MTIFEYASVSRIMEFLGTLEYINEAKLKDTAGNYYEIVTLEVDSNTKETLIRIELTKEAPPTKGSLRDILKEAERLGREAALAKSEGDHDKALQSHIDWICFFDDIPCGYETMAASVYERAYLIPIDKKIETSD